MKSQHKATAVILVGAAALAAYGFAKAKAAGNLNYYLQGVSASLDGFTPIIALYVAIQNPSNEQFQMNSITGNLFSNGSHIGTVSDYTAVTIPGPGEATITIKVRIDLQGVALDLYNLLINGNGNAKSIRFTGFINGMGIVVPVDIKQDIF